MVAARASGLSTLPVPQVSGLAAPGAHSPPCLGRLCHLSRALPCSAHLLVKAVLPRVSPERLSSPGASRQCAVICPLGSQVLPKLFGAFLILSSLLTPMILHSPWDACWEQNCHFC